jgi:hypothetical protein
MSTELGPLVEAAGMVNFLSHGAASHVSSEGCNGVTQEHLERFAALLVAQRLPAPAVDEALRLAVERTREDLGPTGSNYQDVRKLLEFAEQAIAAGRA